MKLRNACVIGILSCFSAAACAACDNGSTTVFSCLTPKGKRIEVCDAKKTIDYSYGKPKLKPEIVVRVPRAEASTTQWTGVGRWMSYSVEIPNGNVKYSVFWGVDRNADDHPIEAGVNVEINKKHAATVTCDPKGKIVQNMEGIKLKPTE